MHFRRFAFVMLHRRSQQSVVNSEMRRRHA